MPRKEMRINKNAECQGGVYAAYTDMGFSLNKHIV